MRASLRKATKSFGGVVSSVALRIRSKAHSRAPWDRSVLDDIAARRPWNLRVKLARLAGRFRRRRPGITVIVVNWNTGRLLDDVLTAVSTFSPSGVRVLVVDNGSSDDSLDRLRARNEVRTIRLRSNPGHGVALDLAICSCRTSTAVILDSDAIPLRDGWLDAVVDLMGAPVILAGQRSKRDFVHPMFAAVDVEAFIRRRLSFQVHRAHPDASDWGTDAWDTGELLTARLMPQEVAFIERTTAPEGVRGMVSAAAVYHHGGVSRSLDGEMTPEAYAEWRNACGALGLDAILPPEGSDSRHVT